MKWQLDADLGAPFAAALATVIRPPSPSMMLREIARPMPVPVRRVVKYGSKTRGRSSGAMPVPRSRTVMAHALAVEPARSRSRMGASRLAPSAPARLDRLDGVAQDVDQDLAQPLGSVVDFGNVRIEVQTARPAWCRPAAAARTASRRQRVDVGRRELELDRPGEIEDLGDDPVQARDLLVDVRAARFT